MSARIKICFLLCTLLFNEFTLVESFFAPTQRRLQRQRKHIGRPHAFTNSVDSSLSKHEISTKSSDVNLSTSNKDTIPPKESFRKVALSLMLILVAAFPISAAHADSPTSNYSPTTMKIQCMSIVDERLWSIKMEPNINTKGPPPKILPHPIEAVRHQKSKSLAFNPSRLMEILWI